MSGKTDTLQQPRTSTNGPVMSTLLIKLAKYCTRLAIRLFFTVFLIGYSWVRNLGTRMLAPLEPIGAEIRKVPKRDVSLQGVFYQFLRLEVLLVLWVWPLLVSMATYVTLPLVRFGDWMFDFLEMTDGEKEE